MDTPHRPRLFATKIALIAIIAALWISALFDWSHVAYRWEEEVESPHPEIGIARLEPKLPWLDEKEALVVHGSILWERTARAGRLVLFSARGEAGEPAVRLAALVPDEPGTIRTIGYAVRGEESWRFVTGEAAERLETRDRARPGAPPRETPSLSAPPGSEPRSP